MATNDAQIEQTVTTTLHHNRQQAADCGQLHKFTKLINFIIISANYWGSYSSVCQNTWSKQQTL